LNFNGILQVIEIHVFLQNLIRLSAAVYKLSCSRRKKHSAKNDTVISFAGSNKLI